MLRDFLRVPTCSLLLATAGFLLGTGPAVGNTSAGDDENLEAIKSAAGVIVRVPVDEKGQENFAAAEMRLHTSETAATTADDPTAIWDDSQPIATPRPATGNAVNSDDSTTDRRWGRGWGHRGGWGRGYGHRGWGRGWGHRGWGFRGWGYRGGYGYGGYRGYYPYYGGGYYPYYGGSYYPYYGDSYYPYYGGGYYGGGYPYYGYRGGYVGFGRGFGWGRGYGGHRYHYFGRGGFGRGGYGRPHVGHHGGRFGGRGFGGRR